MFDVIKKLFLVSVANKYSSFKVTAIGAAYFDGLRGLFAVSCQ